MFCEIWGLIYMYFTNNYCIIGVINNYSKAFVKIFAVKLWTYIFANSLSLLFPGDEVAQTAFQQPSTSRHTAKQIILLLTY